MVAPEQGKIKRRSAADSIADNLRSRIMSGSLPPGERLIEADLAEQLSVSRTPLREALQQLESEGFAERLLGGGLVVTGLDEPDLKNLLWLRLILECELAREVARVATPADVADLTRILDQMEPVSDHPPLFIELGRGFHDRLAAIFGNERCRIVLRQVRQHSDRYWNLTTAHEPERTGLAATEHRAILAAIRAHDEETAMSRMRAHILAETEVCLAAVRATRSGGKFPLSSEEAAS
jgi:DNA-binding GntR family transcriptional regulator